MSRPLSLATVGGGGYFDESYPPSIYVPPAPPVVPATGATAGTPGTWTPAGSTPPATVAESAGIVATPATAWSAGQYVQGTTAGAPGEMAWTGTAWVGGRAPAEEPEAMAAQSATIDPGTLTVADVQAYVAEHPDQLDEIYASEQAGRGRSTLLAWLDSQRAGTDAS